MINITWDKSFGHRALWIAALGLLVSAAAALGQTPADPADRDAGPVAGQEQPLSAAELEELVGRVALYPDDLIAIILPASTYPLQIVQAARYLDAHAADASLEPDAAWDDSIVALLNYPEALAMLNEDLDWTWSLGEAVLYQQAEVLDAIQGFRDRAYAAGNLRSDEHQVVSEDGGVIEIQPADREVIYVPYYEPDRVIVRHRTPVVHYYPYRYPLYYYPYSIGYPFHAGFFWGVTTAFSIGWHTHNLHFHHHHYRSHPYFGYNYYNHYYLRRPVNISRYGYVYRGNRPGYRRHYAGDVWQPRRGWGARPDGGASVTRGVGRVATGVPGAREPRRVRNQPVIDTRADTSRGGPTRTIGRVERGSTVVGGNSPSRSEPRRVRNQPRDTIRADNNLDENSGTAVRGGVRLNRDRQMESRARLGGRDRSQPAARRGAGETLERNVRTVRRSAASSLPTRPGTLTRLGVPSRDTLTRGDASSRVSPAPGSAPRSSAARIPGGRTFGGVGRSPSQPNRAGPARSQPRAGSGLAVGQSRAGGGVPMSQPRAGGGAGQSRFGGVSMGQGQSANRGGGMSRVSGSRGSRGAAGGVAPSGGGGRTRSTAR